MDNDSTIYTGVYGVLSRVGNHVERISEAVFTCQRCGADTVVPQYFDHPLDAELQEPYKCESCERQGPFKIDGDKCSFTDFRALRVTQPPGEGAAGDQLELDCYVRDDMVNVGCDTTPEGEPLSYRAGERVVVHGILERVPSGKKSADFTNIMQAKYVSFESQQDEVADLSDPRISENASASDASERFRGSMSPGTFDTAKWEVVKKVSEAFLFGAPTVNIGGEGKRGDIHFAIFGDPGMNKSQF
ncbi:MAG: hypothetical protein ABEI52_04035, partial [Halobacteriaceae archaeon]